ncbi:MAG: hypothetical protein EBS42_16715, partial [Caulobacteraceae bacterium]|nr:hypothetical protein [Caulobacteraceae bacterium]
EVSDTGVDFEKTFDSGEHYKGKVVKTGFSLFGLPGQGSPSLFSTSGSDYKVGRTDRIENNGSEVWPNSSSVPPVQDYFYGDFGLALKKGTDGIDNLFAQLTYGDKAKPGYIVSLGPYGAMSGSSLQLGLSHADLHNVSTRWFAMQGTDPSKPFEHSGLPSFSAELLDSNLGLSGLSQPPLNLPSLGLNLDTARDWGLGLNQGRLMLPIRDHHGRCCGFSGRLLQASQDPAVPKYRNSAADVLFQRNQLLFGLDRAAEAIRRTGEVLRAAAPRARSSFSLRAATRSPRAPASHRERTRRAPPQRQRLQRAGAHRLILALDGDEAGRRATQALIRELRPMALADTLALSVVPLPDGQDPDTV